MLSIHKQVPGSSQCVRSIPGLTNN